ncbi:2Fe-2S ferredoxin [mine drainage metagenome]|uniref:2Fe-2S ferredoxin n=1 Tax=mine drainage metagenome TaxID=410659 RepID=A0A1J5QMW3_9ZZZZ
MFFFRKAPAHTVTVLPNPEVCPAGEVVPAMSGKSVVEILLDGDVEISHSCQMQCACTTCHIYVMEGEQFMTPMGAEEDRMLDQIQDRRRWSRLACQTVFEGGGDVVVEIRN